MTRSTDLPAALPLAIAAGLVALIVAPWLQGSDADACSASPAQAVGHSAPADCD